MAGNTNVYLDFKPEVDRATTIAAIVAAARRDNTPVHNDFVAIPEASKSGSEPPSPPPLADLVRRHDRFGLNLELLMLTKASSDITTGRFNVNLQGVVINRALGVESPDSDTARTALSKARKRLKEQGLIRVTRSGRWADVELLHESGSGQPYSIPGKKGHYARLSNAYWLEKPKGYDQPWYMVLNVPEIAVLLIANYFYKHPFELKHEYAVEDFGISADTIGRGLRGLREKGAIETTTRYVPAPLSATGYTELQLHRLLPPFEKKKPGKRPGKAPNPANRSKAKARSGRTTRP
jgi:hypothetical protein